MCIKMNFSKKVIVTNHAVERMMERRVDMTPRAWNADKKSPKKYIGDMLKFKNIKRMERKADELLRFTQEGDLQSELKNITIKTQYYKYSINSEKKKVEKHDKGFSHLGVNELCQMNLLFT